VEEVYRWGLFDRDPMKSWSKGRVTLLGDAAHPMLPFLSQGAAMAIEDAYVLAASLGAVAIFLAARAGLGHALAAPIETSEGTLKRLKQGLHEHEISVLLLMRLVPAVPFFVANLVPALVGVRFANFALTTVLGIIPGAIVFTWIGVGLGEVFDRGESPDLSLLWEPQIIGPILGLAALAALPIVIKAIRGRRNI
jgi:uncharacterized membrane protein YdjX (TVP38/TMEM64 family)